MKLVLGLISMCCKWNNIYHDCMPTLPHTLKNEDYEKNFKRMTPKEYISINHFNLNSIVLPKKE